MVRGSNPRWVTKIKGRRNASFLVTSARDVPAEVTKKKRGVAPFYFGDIVGVRTPQGFGGCALRRRLRQCSLNKERLLCFLLQQNRSSTLNRTHPVGHLPPRYFGGASLAKAPKPSAASFYFGDIVGVRTPEGFDDFGKTALNVRAAEEEVGGDIEKVAEADELLIVALKRPFFVALINGLGDTEVSRDLRLRHPAGTAQKPTRQTRRAARARSCRTRHFGRGHGSGLSRAQLRQQRQAKQQTNTYKGKPTDK